MYTAYQLKGHDRVLHKCSHEFIESIVRDKASADVKSGIMPGVDWGADRSL